MDAHLLSIIHEDDTLPQRSQRRIQPTYGREGREGASSPPHAVSGYLFGGEGLRPRTAPPALSPDPSIRLLTRSKTVKLVGTNLVVSPFRMARFGLTYVNGTELRIQLRDLRPGHFRVLAVHNFRSEDRTPDLGQCIAGIFLARWDGGRWEEPERYPIECRSIRLLGEVVIGEVPNRPVAP